MDNKKDFFPISSSCLNGNEIDYLKNCISSNWLTYLGEYVELFEQHFSKYINVDYSMACSNGTVALHLALMAIGIKPGDEVIVPSFTFIASVNAILYVGATPVFVDINPATFCMNEELITSKITSKTKAIMPVHLYGNSCEMNIIMEIAKSQNLMVIEDCAEAIGATYYNQKLGSLGHISCFSLYANKIITSGEGGVVCTNDPVLAERIKMLRDHGMSKSQRYVHEILGYNYRITNLQAAVALAQIEQIEEFMKQRALIFNWYYQYLQKENIQMPYVGDENIKPVNWLFTILVKKKTRDGLAEFLKKNNIDTRPVFHPAHKMNYIKTVENLPNTDFVSSVGLSLPTYVGLTEENVKYISNRVNDFFAI